ncbi:hypothetical protein AAFN90_04200 [Erwiniaceae bacterium CAU 1747]
MNTAPSLSLAYDRRHSSLLAQRSQVQSAETIQRVNRALLAGERVSAAFYDLSQRKLLQQRKSQPLLTPKAEKEIARFLDELNDITPETVADKSQFDALQKQVSRLLERFHWKHASPILVHNALFNHTYHQWQHVLQALFSDADDVFPHLQRILSDSSRKLPVLGETTSLFKRLTKLLTECREKSAQQDLTEDPLVGFIAAADIATRGMIIFGATAEAVLRGSPIPQDERLDRLIKEHYQQVVERMHPWFTAV